MCTSVSLVRELACSGGMEEKENPLVSFLLAFFLFRFWDFFLGGGGGRLFVLFYFFCGVVYFLLFSFPGLKAADRTSVQNEWMEEKIPVIVATISFGMGVDKANVRCVRLSVVHHQRLKPE